LPVKKDMNVTRLDYSIGKVIQQDGRFLFDTMLSFNGGPSMPLYTVVESVDGKWTVNIKDSFMTSNAASLNHSTDLYAAYLRTSRKYIGYGVKAKFDPSLITPDQDRQIDDWVESVFAEAKDEFKQRYINSL